MRLVPLLLLVLANEFERDGPGKDNEEGSGMDCARPSKLERRTLLTLGQSKTRSGQSSTLGNIM